MVKKMEIIIRSFFIFTILFLITKVLGKKQIQHLTLFDYVIGITIGSIGADSIINLDYSIWNGIIALVVFGVIGFIFSYFSYKSHKTEEMLDGTPLLLFSEDHFISENLEHTKISVSKILEHCRLKGCFDLSQLQCVFLEPSGDFSVLLKTQYQSSSTGDFKKEQMKKSYKQTLCYYLVIDGEIDYLELEHAGKDEKWLNIELKKQNIKLSQVSLFSLDGYDRITIFEK